MMVLVASDSNFFFFELWTIHLQPITNPVLAFHQTCIELVGFIIWK